MIKYLYFFITFPIVYLQRFLHLTIFQTFNSTKVNEKLYISGIFHFLYELNYWKKENIGIVINLATEFPFKKRNTEFCKKNGILYFEFQVPDRKPVSKDQLQEILSIVLSNSEKKVFVNCASGVGRSAMTIIYLLVKLGYCNTLGEAENELKKVRPIISLKYGQRKMLKSIFN